MFANRGIIETTADNKWMFEDAQTKECSYFMLSAADAKYRIFFGAAGYAGVATGPNQMLDMMNERQKEFPKPKPIRGSNDKKPIPFTFVGQDKFNPRPWLRVRSAGQSEEYNAEISRALRPGEIAEKILLDRFRVLNKTLHVHTPAYITRINCMLRALHNYFITENPAYSAEYADVSQLVKEIKVSPIEKPKPEKEVKKEAPTSSEDDLKMPADHKQWMKRMGIDEKAFQKLLKLIKPHNSFECDIPLEMRLRVVLRLMATGRGYLQEMDLMFTGTFLAMAQAMKAYTPEVIEKHASPQ